MQDNVERLRRRWTPELTAAAVRALKGHAAGAAMPKVAIVLFGAFQYRVYG